MLRLGVTNAPLQDEGRRRAKSTCTFLWVEICNPLNASQLLLSFKNARFSVPMTVCSSPCDSHRFSADNHAEQFCINIRNRNAATFISGEVFSHYGFLFCVFLVLLKYYYYLCGKITIKW